MNIQVNGLAGHEHEFYVWVSESDWTGGEYFYSDLEEGKRLAIIESFHINSIMVRRGVDNSSSILAS